MHRLLLLIVAIFSVAGASGLQARTEGSAILVYSGTTGYRHDSIPAGIDALTAIAKRRGLAVVASEDPGIFSTDSLRRFRAIVLLSCTTNPKDPASEWLVGDRRTALQNFVERGGGVLAIHAAADSHYNWPWYGKLIGGRFERHPSGTPRGTIRSIATGETRQRTDEWYYFDDYDPTSKLLVTLDPQSIGEKDVNPNPVSWTRSVGRGRVFYTAMGHTKESYSEPWFLRHIADGLDWVLGRK